jgi:hypothetical protein
MTIFCIVQISRTRVVVGKFTVYFVKSKAQQCKPALQEAAERGMNLLKFGLNFYEKDDEEFGELLRTIDLVQQNWARVWGMVKRHREDLFKQLGKQKRVIQNS